MPWVWPQQGAPAPLEMGSMWYRPLRLVCMPVEGGHRLLRLHVLAHAMLQTTASKMPIYAARSAGAATDGGGSLSPASATLLPLI